MYSQIRTSMLDGICAMPVQVEVDISMGMPVFDMVGYLSSEVREAKERVRTALHNCGILLPAKRITVNLSPANIRKTGAGKTGEVRGHDFFRGVEFKWTVTAGPGNSADGFGWSKGRDS